TITGKPDASVSHRQPDGAPSPVGFPDAAPVSRADAATEVADSAPPPPVDAGTPDSAPPPPVDAAPPPPPDAAPTCTVMTPQLLGNPGFESGHQTWTEDINGQDGEGLIYNKNATQVAPQAGNYLAWLGGVTSEEDHLYQQVTIPAGTTAL